MGYLSQVFNTYYNSTNQEQKENLKKDFQEIIWKSLPYTKLNKFFKYKISYQNIKDQDVLNIFEQYQYIEYKILKSRYNINKLGKEDLIKARINSNYGKYFDKEVYLQKEYYWALAEYRNIYFKYLKGEIDNLEDVILANNKRVEQLKQESLNRKYEMSWKDYKAFINMCFDKIFDNYQPIDNKIKDNDFKPNHILDWDEDNYILGYVNKSLNGYLKNYISNLNSKRKGKEYVNYIDMLENYDYKKIIFNTNSNEFKYVVDLRKLTTEEIKLLNKIEDVLKSNIKSSIFIGNKHQPYMNKTFVSEKIGVKYYDFNNKIKLIRTKLQGDDVVKVCIICGKKFDSNNPNRKTCSTKCSKEHTRNLRKKNSKKWRENNKDRFKKLKSDWSKNNRDKINARQRELYNINKNRYKEYIDKYKKNIIYMFEYKNEIVYVGSTNNIYRRIYEHNSEHHNEGLWEKYNEFKVLISDIDIDDDVLLDLEYFYIDKYKPILNKKVMKYKTLDWFNDVKFIEYKH
mgnify:CR=1 FL=1